MCRCAIKTDALRDAAAEVIDLKAAPEVSLTTSAQAPELQLAAHTEVTSAVVAMKRTSPAITDFEFPGQDAVTAVYPADLFKAAMQPLRKGMAALLELNELGALRLFMELSAPECVDCTIVTILLCRTVQNAAVGWAAHATPSTPSEPAGSSYSAQPTPAHLAGIAPTATLSASSAVASSGVPAATG